MTAQALTDANGNVVWKADYRPFGEAEVVIGDVGNEIRFPGQYFDAESGLHYNWHRYYEPETGRYLRPDPIGLDGGINLYAYVQNNPLTNIDPYGLDTWAGMSVEADVIFILYGGVSKVVGSLTNRSTGETCYYEIKCKKVGIGLMLFGVSGSGNIAFKGPKCGKNLCGTSVGAGIDIGYAAFAASVDSNGTGTLGGGIGVGPIPSGAMAAMVCKTKKERDGAYGLVGIVYLISLSILLVSGTLYLSKVMLEPF